MKEKLELKHLAPYLPYELVINCDFKDGSVWNCKLEALSGDEAFLDGCDWEYETNNDFKPILRPLSDLTKKIEHNGEIFVPIDYLKNNYSGFYFASTPELLIIRKNTNLYLSLQWSVEFYNKLLEWHFDVFYLIEKGLAIDKNKL